MVKSTKRKNLIVYALAILVIVVILFLIFSQDVINPGETITACIAQSGFACQNPSYNHANGNISIEIGQYTGQNWQSANFVFVPENGNNDILQKYFTIYDANTTYSTIGLKQQTLINLDFAASGRVSVGQPIDGSIWVQYTTVNGTQEYAKILSLYLHAD